MAGKTPQAGYDYPNSSDLIAEGAVNIEQLAEDIESDFWLAPNAYGPDDPYSSYPTPGMTVFNVNASGSDWPYRYGTVVTIKRASNQAWQWFYSYTTVQEQQVVYLRIGYTTADAIWGDWQTVVGPGTPNAMAAGSVTVTPTAGAAKAVTITLPANRFQSEDTNGKLRPQLTAGGATRPQDIALCVYSINTSSMVAYLYRTTQTDTSIGWQVTQGLDQG